MLSSQITQASRLLPRVGSIGAVGCRQKHTLPALPYEYNALEPCISAEIMQIHHQKHHQTYVNNLNAAEDALKVAVDERNTSKIISLQPALKFNGGGHLNHSIFWEVLSPKGGGLPSGDLMLLIKNNFGSFDKMKDEMTASTIGIQGSGWGWLGYNPTSGRLRISTMPNQDPLFPVTEGLSSLQTSPQSSKPSASAYHGLIPLFGIDVWEHAYYLQYKNVRPDYVKAIFDIANWTEASRRLEQARMSS